MGIKRDRYDRLVAAEFIPTTLNNVSDPIHLDFNKGECASLVNVDVGEGGVSRRSGYSLAISGNVHSGWSSPTRDLAFYVKNGVLTQFYGSVERSIKTVNDVQAAYCEANDVVLFSNGFEYGIIQDGTWYTPAVPTEPFNVSVPAGNLLCFYNGRVYVAKDGVVYCTDSFTVEWCDERDYVVAAFDGAVNMLSAVDDGLWIGTDKEIFFFKGADPTEGGFTQISAADYGCVFGTASVSKGEILKDGPSGAIVVFASHRGVCIGGNGGSFRNITKDYYTYDYGQKGCSVIRFKDGDIQYICNTGTDKEAFNQFEPQALDIDSY